MTQKKQCSTCFFYKRPNCCRFPQALATSSTHWCGEYKFNSAVIEQPETFQNNNSQHRGMEEKVFAPQEGEENYKKAYTVLKEFKPNSVDGKPILDVLEKISKLFERTNRWILASEDRTRFLTVCVACNAANNSWTDNKHHAIQYYTRDAAVAASLSEPDGPWIVIPYSFEN